MTPPDLAATLEKERHRWLYLKAIYEMTNSDTSVKVTTHRIFRVMGIEEQQARLAQWYLKEQGLIKGTILMPSAVPLREWARITPAGVAMYEQVLKHQASQERAKMEEPKGFQPSQPQVTHNHFHAPVGVVQNGENHATIVVPATGGGVLQQTEARNTAQKLLPLTEESSLKEQFLPTLEKQLQHVGLKGPQVKTALKRLNQPAVLGLVTKLASVDDVREAVMEALNYPADLSEEDPKVVEASLICLALLRTVLIVTAPSLHQALTADLQTLGNVALLFPGLGAVMEEHRQRKAALLRSSEKDISRLLQRAGQQNMQVTFSSNGRPVFSGEAVVTLHLPHHQFLEARQWMDSNEGEPLTLSWAAGPMTMTYGDPELDAMLIPSEKFDLKLHPPVMEYHLRLKVRNGTEARVLPAIMIMQGKQRTLKFGHSRFSVDITSPDEGKKAKFNLSYHTGPHPLPAEDEVLLEGLLLLLSPSGQALILSAKNPRTGEVITVPEPTVFLNRPKDARHGKFLQPIKIHLTLLRLVQFAVKHGFDQQTLTMPEQLNTEQTDILLTLQRTMETLHSPRQQTFTATLQKDVYEMGTVDWSSAEVVHTVHFQLGEAIFVAEQPINQLKLLSTRRSKADYLLEFEGQLGGGTIEVLTETEAEQRLPQFTANL